MKGFNDKLIKKGETVGVALSGGKDSVCLLFLLKELSESIGFNLVAVNVEHGIRGESSLNDTLFCKNLCEKLSVPFKGYTVDVLSLVKKDGLSLEEAARKLRYECFYDAVKIGFCNKIACAHHKNDNVETVIFNLLRGTTVSGLRGMEEVSVDGVIVRPMLGVSKDDIDEYINRNGIDYVSDETNDDVKYTRNFIRHEVLPLLSSRFPGVYDSVERLSLSAKSDDAYLYSLAKKELVYSGGVAYISCDAPKPIFSRAAILALKALGVQKDFDNSHIAALFDLTRNQSGKQVDLLGGLYGVKEGDKIAIKRKKEKIGFLTEFKKGIISVSDGKLVIEDAREYKKDGTNYVDYDKIPHDAVVRKRLVGDVFYKFGGGKVSLKKFLTDKKIPKDEKDKLYLVASGNIVYVIIGVEISSLCKIDENTRNIVKIFKLDN